MAKYGYAIGLTYPPDNMEDLGINAPRSVFYEASGQADRLDGQVVGRGYPRAVWRFDVLTQAMVNSLRALCPGQSASVYIRTRRADGAWEDYTAILVWPLRQMEKRNFNGRYLGLEFEFRRLQVVDQSQLSFYQPENSGYLLLI